MPGKQTVYLDTNVFIYYFQEHPDFGVRAKKLFDRFFSGELFAVTSVLTLTEFLSKASTEEDADTMYRLFLETPNLLIVPISSEIAVVAARLRRVYSLQTPDAIQLATAVDRKVTKFITNDKRLLRCKDVAVSLL